MTERSRAVLVFLTLAIVAAAFRFPRLADRPMHADEAVNAHRLGRLLDEGRYEYSAIDYHGPTLLYMSLAAARAQGIRRYVDLDEVALRAVPALLGVLLVAAHFWLIPYLGLTASAFAGLFAAVSPAMVYYSRYFIHEMLLVLLTFCFLLAVLSYFANPTNSRAAVAGAFLGLMFATKETAVIAVACVLAAHALLRALSPVKSTPDPQSGTGKHPTRTHFALAIAVAAAISITLMSSFFTHPRGIVDMVLAYRIYLGRGAGVATFHVHPWYSYFDWLFYFHGVWSEAVIVAVALVGWAIAWRSPGIPRFLGLYTVLMVVVYSAIPYKAPWNALSFLHGLILMAGIGAAWLIQRTSRTAMLVALFAGVSVLGWQAHAASFTDASDPRNPWVYAHTGTDVFAIMHQVEALAAVHPAGRAMPIQVISRENLWPLPWYLRRFSGVRWWTGVSERGPIAPLILATPEMEPALIHKIYDLPPPGQREMYVNMFGRYVELRPRVEVRGYVAKFLWDQWEQAR